MLLDQLLILRNPRLARNTRPIRTRRVIKTHIDMIIALDLVELVRGVVSEEEEMQALEVFFGVVWGTGCHGSTVECAC